MIEFQKRVLDEHNELSARVDKLEAFIREKMVFPLLHIGEQGRLLRQLTAMKCYKRELHERINHFEDQEVTM